MNKTLLKQLIREEIKNLKEQHNNIDEESVNDPEQAIRKMADALGVDISVSLSAGYNTLTFRQRKDVDEKTFEQMIQFLETIGYNVDLGQSNRMYDFEQGERDFFPRIRF